jgi:hypothetical protein
VSLYCLVGDGVVYGPPACGKVRVLRLALGWNWYEIPFGTVGSLQATGALPTSNGVGLSENNFLQVALSVVFIDTHLKNIISVFVDLLLREVCSLCVIWYVLWDYGFESRQGHRCLFLVSVVCCQVKVSASGWSLVQRSSTEFGVSECNREAWIMSTPWPTKGCCVVGKKGTDWRIRIMNPLEANRLVKCCW